MRKLIIKRQDGGNAPNPGDLVSNLASDVVDFGNTLFADRQEYSGQNGGIAQGLDAGYNQLENIVGKIPVYGKLLKGVWKANKLVSGITKKLGGGTDGATKIDNVLGSNFLQMTPFGLINGFFGKTADSFTKDDELFSQANSSYSGANSMADFASDLSGTKYGAFSGRARRKANKNIATAKIQQSTTQNILDNANAMGTLASTMSDTIGNAYQNKLNGGYQQDMVYAAKNGGWFSKEVLLRAKRIAKAKNGIQLPLNTYNWPKFIAKDQQFMKFISTLPDEWKEYSEEHEDLYDIWRENGKPKTFSESTDNLNNPLFTLDEEGNTVINPDISEKEEPKKEKEEEKIDSYEDFKMEVEKLADQDKADFFQKGGQLNLIPEGALHAHKHHIEQTRDDLEGNITHKGIPVISVSEGGEVEQNAEIERNEIIFNLEVTEQIEELRKKYHETESPTEKDKIAEEAGRILSDSIMEDTDDKTGLIDSIKE